jgi:DNA-binding NarL/FixJ family response regulator
MTIRVLLADDHKIVRDGLRTLLEKQADIAVLGEAEDGREALQLAGKLSPDVVVMDIAMPELNGIEATRQILSEYPGIKIVALSMHSDKRFVSEMLKAGASAYLLKDCAFEELITAISTIMKGKIYLSPGIAGVVLADYIRNDRKSEPSVFSQLSDREREVLQLMAEGKSTKEVAAHLNVSIKTVETHRTNIMTKLDIHSIAELTKYAIREGLTSL